MTEEKAGGAPEAMRLQRYLARAGVCSRRAAEELIAQGCVAVNGRAVTQLGTKVVPRRDKVEVDGREVAFGPKAHVIMLNKPAGYLSSMADPHAAHLVSELVPTDRFPGLFPIGRLDKDTTGLLLFTDDGELGNRLLHPSSAVGKEYLAWVAGRPTRRELSHLEQGVELEDGMTAPARARLLRYEPDYDEALVSLTIHEGRKRQVKRMAAAIGHPVLALHRARFAGLALNGLEEGRWRILDDSEVASLREAAGYAYGRLGF